MDVGEVEAGVGVLDQEGGVETSGGKDGGSAAATCAEEILVWDRTGVAEDWEICVGDWDRGGVGGGDLYCGVA